jgi:hypothetical protein
LLLVDGLLYTTALWRRERVGEATGASLALVLLLIVALTPSLDGLHLVCSLLLLSLLFGYYAVLLYRAGSVWIAVHLPMPIVLLLATYPHGYGLWQKAFIVYLVLASAIHHHLVGRAGRLERPRTHRARRGQRLRRRVVYTLEPGRSWGRRGAAGSSA